MEYQPVQKYLVSVKNATWRTQSFAVDVEIPSGTRTPVPQSSRIHNVTANLDGKQRLPECR
jgi:hypothetical protein